MNPILLFPGSLTMISSRTSELRPLPQPALFGHLDFRNAPSHSLAAPILRKTGYPSPATDLKESPGLCELSRQPVSVPLALLPAAVCVFLLNAALRARFHCDECGICRIGGRDNFFHCATCGCCYATTLQDKHKCVEKSMHHNCPVCFEVIPRPCLSCAFMTSGCPPASLLSASEIVLRRG